MMTMMYRLYTTTGIRTRDNRILKRSKGLEQIKRSGLFSVRMENKRGAPVKACPLIQFYRYKSVFEVKKRFSGSEIEKILLPFFVSENRQKVVSKKITIF